MKHTILFVLGSFIVCIGGLLLNDFWRFPLDCDALKGNSIFNLQSNPVVSEGIEAWIVEQYGVRDITVAEGEYPRLVSGAGRTTSYLWTHNHIRYNVTFDVEGLRDTRLLYDERYAPTGAELVACLGEPSAYQFSDVSIELHGIRLALWYDSLHMEAQTVKWFYPWERQGISGQNNRFDYLILYPLDRYQVETSKWSREGEIQTWESWDDLTSDIPWLTGD